jgi:hypothetical protein
LFCKWRRPEEYGRQKVISRQNEEKVGGEGKDRFDPSTCRFVHQERRHHRKDPGFQEGFTQGAEFRNAHAYLFHQPCRTRAQRQAAGGAGKSENLAFPTRAFRKRASKKKRQKPEAQNLKPPACLRAWHGIAPRKKRHMRIHEGNFAYDIEQLRDPLTQLPLNWRYTVYRLRPVEEVVQRGEAESREEAEITAKGIIAELINSEHRPAA